MVHNEFLAINDESDLIGRSGEQSDGVLVCRVRHVNIVDLEAHKT